MEPVPYATLEDYARMVVADTKVMVDTRSTHGITTSVLYSTLLTNQDTFMTLNINSVGYFIIRTWISVYFGGSVSACLLAPTTSELWSLSTIFSYATFIIGFNYKLKANETPEQAIVAVISSNKAYSPNNEITQFKRSFRIMRAVDSMYGAASLCPPSRRT
jgi:hypothetical protein